MRRIPKYRSWDEAFQFTFWVEKIKQKKGEKSNDKIKIIIYGPLNLSSDMALELLTWASQLCYVCACMYV